MLKAINNSKLLNSLRLTTKPSKSGAKFIKTKSRIEKSVKDYVACELR